MDLFDLTGKVAIITGSSRGIGLAIAEAFARAGAKVAISSRHQTECDLVAAKINAAHGKGTALACAADLADKASLQNLVDETREALGPMDILVGNAAANTHFGPIATITDDQFRSVLETNLLANHWLVHMVTPEMIARKGGAIILVSSVGGFTGSSQIGAYNISKAALMQMTRNLAVEYGRNNIRVNAIAPGTVRTELARPLWEDPVKEAERANATVLGRIGEPEELAGAALYLASKAGSFTTGHTLVVDGGRLI